MNFENFRRTGELSDLTVVVNKTEFKLHTFPLFIKSDYFKKAVASLTSSTPHVIEFDQNFPGGAEIFSQVADYLYSIPISIEEKTIVPLRLAACFIECDALASLVDQHFNELLLLARAKNDLTVPLTLLEQCAGEQQALAKQSHIVDTCLECLVESLANGVGLQLSKSDRESLVRLPLEWIVQLIQLCPTESKLAILPFVKHYLTVRVLEQQPSSIGQDTGGENPSAFTLVTKPDDRMVTTEKDKRTIIDEIVKVLNNAFEQLPLVWLNSFYEKAVELKCECEPILSSCITQSLLNSADFDESLNKIPDEIMARVLERVSRNKEDHIKDPQSLAKLSNLIDSYVDQLRERGELTSEQFVRLASCIPKEQRSSHDILLRALDEILKDERSTQLSSLEREELLNQIDFSRVNEATIAACKTNTLIPQQLITDAALALCIQLRSQLDDTQSRLHSVESQLRKTQLGYDTSSNYRSRYLDSSYRLPQRSRSNYTTNYDLLRSPPVYSYTKYDTELDLDHFVPPRYLSSASSSRYAATYSSYRY